jgi:ABC-2 type transport system permease protein
VTVRRRPAGLRLAWRITRLNLRSQLEYRADFLMTVALGAAWQASVFVFASVILSRFSAMAGWRTSDVLLIVSMRMLSHSLYVLSSGRLYDLPFLVQEGSIDTYLLRPLSVYRQVQLTSFPANAFGDLTVAIAMLAGAISRSTLSWHPSTVGFLAAGVLGGVLVERAVGTCMASAALHLPASSYWSSWLDELFSTFGSYPLSILPTAARTTFTFVIPLAFIAYFPAGVLTGHGATLGVPMWLAAASPVVGLTLYALSRRLWAWSLNHYTGVNG